MECWKCKKELNEDFKLCPYCGSKVIKNPTECPHCHEVVNGDLEVCSQCGKRLDGTRVCPHCNNQIEEDYKYCPYCASKIVDDENKKVEIIKKVKEKKVRQYIKLNEILEIVKRGTLTLIALLMFIFSFTNIFQLEMVVDTGIQIDSGVSTFDYLSSWGVDENYNLQEFEYEYADKIALWNTASEDEVDYEDLGDFIEDTNPIKFLISGINDEYEGSKPRLFAIETRIIVGIVGILVILTTCGYLAYCLYDGYKFYKKEKVKRKNYLGFEVTLVVLYILAKVFRLDMGGVASNVSDMFNAILALAITSALIKTGFVIYESYEKSKEWYINLAKKGIKTAALVSVIFLLFAPVVKTVNTLSSDRHYTRVNFEYDATDFIQYELLMLDKDFLDDIDTNVTPSEYRDDYELLIGEYGDVIEVHGKTNIFANPLGIMHNVFSINNKYDSLIVFVVTSVFQIVLAIGIVVYLGYDLVNKDNKREKSIINGILVGFGITVLILTIIQCSSYKEVKEDLRLYALTNIKYLAYIPISLALLVCVNVIDSSVIKIKEKEEI